MALSGFCFFGPDIGGFAGPKPDRELFIRWLQYGVFLPRFVLHSWKENEASTMPWLYPELMDTVKAIFGLRERLLPYLIDQMKKCVADDLPLITPVFLKDEKYDREADCFMCGEKILVCPIFDEGKNTIDVRLPYSTAGFRLRGQGKIIEGNTSVRADCTINDLPVWFEEVE